MASCERCVSLPSANRKSCFLLSLILFTIVLPESVCLRDQKLLVEGSRRDLRLLQARGRGADDSAFKEPGSDEDSEELADDGHGDDDDDDELTDDYLGSRFPSSRPFRLVNKASGHALSTIGEDKKLVMERVADTSHNLWRLTNVKLTFEGKIFKFLNLATNRWAKGMTTTSRADSDEQYWRVTDIDGRYFKLYNKGSGLVLGERRNKPYMSKRHFADNQFWEVIDPRKRATPCDGEVGRSCRFFPCSGALWQECLNGKCFCQTGYCHDDGGRCVECSGDECAASNASTDEGANAIDIGTDEVSCEEIIENSRISKSKADPTCKCLHLWTVAGEAEECAPYKDKHYFPVTLPKGLCQCEPTH